MNPKPRHRTALMATPSPAAFTLIEVLLAVGVATALLLAALFFYRQAAQLRADILASSTQLAALRLVLDQLATDLRAAVPAPGRSFIGGPASLEFARFAPPPDSPATAALTNLAPNPPRAPLESVVLSTLIQQDGTNLVVQGISRRTQPLAPQPSGSANPRADTNAPALALETTLAAANPDSSPSPDPLSPALASASPDASNAPDASTNAPAAPPAQGSPLLPVRFLLLRYWNGLDWQDSWFSPAPPQGVEVTLGLEPLPNDMPPEAYPHERFTRVIFIPAGQRPQPTNNLPELPSTPAEATP